MSNYVLPTRKLNRATGLREDWFKCFYCRKDYKEEAKAKKCVVNHDLVLVPIASNDLGRLNQFFYLKDDNLLTEPLVNTVKRFVRQIARNQ